MTIDKIKELIRELFPPEKRVLKIRVTISKDFEKELREEVRAEIISSGLFINSNSISVGTTDILLVSGDKDYTITYLLSDEDIFLIEKLKNQ